MASKSSWSYTTSAAPTLHKYHNSVGRDGFATKVRGVGGPPGSGKSVACAVEHTTFLAMRQEPDNYGYRKTRTVIIRASYDRLKKTTLATVNQWLIPGSGSIKGTAPMEGTLEFKHPSGDGTIVQNHVVFMSIETTDDFEKLDSLEVSNFYLNEANELPEGIIAKCVERMGRYPPAIDGAECTEECVSADFNMQEPSHWIMKYFIGKEGIVENEDFSKDDIAYFEQPPAVFCTNYEDVLESGIEVVRPVFELNPNAENLAHLKKSYYGNQLANNSWAKTQARLMMKRVNENTGKIIHEDYRAEYHKAKERIPVNPKEIVYVGFDTSGHNKGFTFNQYIDGELRTIREAFHKGGTEKAIDDVMTPTLQKYFPMCDVLVVCDPANPRDERSYVSPTQLLREKGYRAVIAPGGNKLELRINAVSYFQTRVGGYKIDPSCTQVIAGFEGGYVFEKDKAASKSLGKDVYKFKKLDNHLAHYIDSIQNVAIYLTSNRKRQSAVTPSPVQVKGRRLM